MGETGEAFSIDLAAAGHGSVLFLRGELDMDTAADAIRAATAAVEATPEVTVDLSGLSFVDSSGLNALVRIRRLTDPASGRIVTLRAPSGPVRKALDLTGLTTFLEIADA